MEQQTLPEAVAKRVVASGMGSPPWDTSSVMKRVRMTVLYLYIHGWKKQMISSMGKVVG